MNHTRKKMLGLAEPLHITGLLKAVSLPMRCSELRFVYDKESIHDVTCAPYIYKEINSLHLVYDNNISYPYKSTDHSALSELKKQQGDCDRILIVRNNHLTDTSYTSITLYNGEQWLTLSTPLLRGTMRQRLFDCELLQEREIMVSDIPDYQYISLSNAMVPLGEVILLVDKIR